MPHRTNNGWIPLPVGRASPEPRRPNCSLGLGAGPACHLGSSGQAQAGGGAQRIFADLANEIKGEKRSEKEEKQARIGGARREPGREGRRVAPDGNGALESGKLLSKNCL